MGDAVAPEPDNLVRLPQNTVVVNGAAINLISQLVESVRFDMRSMEERVNEKIDERFDSHEELHETIRSGDLEFQRRTRERIAGLERQEIEETKDEAVREARRQGQLSVFTGLARIGTGVERYGKLIVLVIAGGITALLAGFGNISITIGPPR